MSQKTVICGRCGGQTQKRSDRVAKAVEAGAPLYCDRRCAGDAKRLGHQQRRASEALDDNFSYAPLTGVVSRIGQRGRGQVGPVGTVGTNGYLVVRFSGQTLTLHRLAWRLNYGTFPDGMIDHVNGDRTDNRLTNLRLATAVQNQANRRCAVGLKGVSLHQPTGKWRATIGNRHLGLFETDADAARAYDEAAVAAWGEYAAPNFPREAAR